jgi:hypothetical protein
MVACAAQTSAANLADDPDIKTIMKKVNGKGAICGKVGADLKAKEPKWDEIADLAKEWVPLAKAMGKNDPPKGDKESWKKLTDAYAKAADDLETAAKDKDLKAAQTAMKTLTACMGCHKLHR